MCVQGTPKAKESHSPGRETIGQLFVWLRSPPAHRMYRVRIKDQTSLFQGTASQVSISTAQSWLINQSCCW